MFEIIAYGVYVALFVAGYALIAYFVLAGTLGLTVGVLLNRVGFDNLAPKQMDWLIETLPLKAHVLRKKKYGGIEMNVLPAITMAVAVIWFLAAVAEKLDQSVLGASDRLVSITIDYVHGTSAFLAEWTATPIVYLLIFSAVWYGLGQLKGPIHTIIDVANKLKKES